MYRCGKNKLRNKERDIEVKPKYHIIEK